MRLGDFKKESTTSHRTRSTAVFSFPRKAQSPSPNLILFLHLGGSVRYEKMKVIRLAFFEVCLFLSFFTRRRTQLHSLVALALNALKSRPGSLFVFFLFAVKKSSSINSPSSAERPSSSANWPPLSAMSCRASPN